MAKDRDRRFLGDEYLNENQLARELGISVRTLRRWRARGVSPPIIQIGREIVYRVDAVKAWLQANERQMPREGRAA